MCAVVGSPRSLTIINAVLDMDSSFRGTRSAVGMSVAGASRLSLNFEHQYSPSRLELVPPCSGIKCGSENGADVAIAAESLVKVPCTLP